MPNAGSAGTFGHDPDACGAVRLLQHPLGGDRRRRGIRRAYRGDPAGKGFSWEDIAKLKDDGTPGEQVTLGGCPRRPTNPRMRSDDLWRIPIDS